MMLRVFSKICLSLHKTSNYNCIKTMNQNFDKISADLVVYGKIFTSENNQIVEAFAVKDGKYVYVGGSHR